MRTLAVGDIHGGLIALMQVLDKCNYDKLLDKIIFLGDYVDGWSQSAEVIEFLINLQKDATETHIFIRGNHDKWCQDWLKTGANPLIWNQQGGQSTLDSYVRTGFLIEDSHRDFFKNLDNYYVDDQNRGFVHGGFNSRKGLGHEHYESDYYWDRDLWQLALLSHDRTHEDGTPQSRRFEKHKEIYIGHTSTGNWKCKPHYPEFHNEKQEIKNGAITVPMNRCNVWNLDTGGGFEGKLTIMDIDTKEFWQSDFVNELYSNEKGR